MCFREEDVSLTVQNPCVDGERDESSMKDTPGERMMHDLLFFT